MANDDARPPSIDDVKAEVPDDVMPSWDSQAAQYPKKGPPGIAYFRGQINADYHVDCLLSRNDDGELVGILNRYPADFPPYEQAGAINVWVHPYHQRKGIATDLLYECALRWPMPQDAKLTEAGVRWVKSMDRKYSGTELDYSVDGWEAWHASMEVQSRGPDPLPTPKSVLEAREVDSKD
jgi:hypothetical protein